MKKHWRTPAGVTGVMLLALGFLAFPALGVVETDYITATNSAATNTFMGKVGVGTGSPSSQFHVVGDSTVDGGLTVSGAMKVPKQGDVDMGSYTNGESGGGTSGSGGSTLSDTNAANSFMSLSFDYMIVQGKSEIGMANGHIDTLRSQALINTNAGYSTNQIFNTTSNYYYNWTPASFTASNGWRGTNIFNQSVSAYGVPAKQGVANNAVNALKTHASNFTVSCWFKFLSLPANEQQRWFGSFHTATMNDFPNGWYWEFYSNTAYTLTVGWGNGSANVSSKIGSIGKLSDTNWHFAVWNHNGANTTDWFYIDGTLSNAAASPAGTRGDFAGTNLTVGSCHRINSPGNIGICGDTIIDEYILFDRSLTAADVAAMWNSGNGLRYDGSTAPYGSNVIAAYHLDELAGSTNFTDSGPNGIPLTLNKLGYGYLTQGYFNQTSIPAATNDMTVVTTNFSLSFTPASLRVTLWQQPYDGTTTVNTDFQAWASRDGGTTFSQVILSAADQYYLTTPASRMYAGTVSVADQPAGSGVVIKVKTLNNKAQKIYGIGWSAF